MRILHASSRRPIRRSYHSAVVGRTLLVATFAALALPIWAAAQFGSFRSPAYPNLQYDDRWVFTRLRYHPSSSWNHDYPRADRHLAYIVADLSKARVHTEGSNVLDLGDPRSSAIHSSTCQSLGSGT